jgi:cytidylate kinase
MVGGADKTRLRNYDVVCDSTSASPEEIVECVVENLAMPSDQAMLYIDPRRIRVPEIGVAHGAVRLAYARPDFVALSGFDRIAEAVEQGLPLVEATLATQTAEQVSA